MSKIEKWNSTYTDKIPGIQNLKPNERLLSLSNYLKGGDALDLACGLGRNSLLLGRMNYTVYAFDFSNVAIEYLREQSENEELDIHPTCIDITDLNQLPVKNEQFDLVNITYYLDRSLFPFVKNIIKDNGYLFIETYYKSPLNTNEGFSEEYKLLPNELLEQFGSWTVLFYEQNEMEGRQTIFARRNKAAE